MAEALRGGAAGSTHSDMVAGGAAAAAGAAGAADWAVGVGPPGPGPGEAGAAEVGGLELAGASGGGSVTAGGLAVCDTGEPGALDIMVDGTADVCVVDGEAGLAWVLGGAAAAAGGSWRCAQVVLQRPADGGAALPLDCMGSAAMTAGIEEDQHAVAGCRDTRGVGSLVRHDSC